MDGMEKVEGWERVWGRFVDAVEDRRRLARASGAKRRAAHMRVYLRWREMKDWCEANGVEVPPHLMKGAES